MNNPYYDIILKHYGEGLYEPYHSDKKILARYKPPTKEVIFETMSAIAAKDMARLSKIGDLTSSFALRELCLQEFAFAIPDKKSLETIKTFSPIIEIGAGTGYWAYCLNQIGVEIVAVDRGDRKSFTKNWVYPILGDHTLIKKFPNHTLFLCWPPYATPMATECLKIYTGGNLIYIGEGDGGCTADDEFHNIIDKEWTQIASVSIPQWERIHDYLSVYKRKEKLGKL